ncbi:hypothetical protein Tsubulata_034341 [Turnera subulata]|uniref:Uncharacterized protein n=1 Tax=Turnera subulata TaxID=218843 RepID=A0A9Q0GMJ7_9ROSI|nr:hypothetical protein Tsubulata_034341 [Turnera subulata]
MADPVSSKIETQKEDRKEPMNLFSLFPKFDFKLPFLNFDHNKAAESKVKVEPSKTAVVVQREAEVEKPQIVRFPNNSGVVPVTLEAEAQVSGGSTSNPAIVWQVYALGGFIVLNWIWARWKERQDRAKKASPDGNESGDDSDGEN